MTDNNWISVEDDMPKKAGYYLVVVDEMVASKARGVVEISDCYESINPTTYKPYLN